MRYLDAAGRTDRKMLGVVRGWGADRRVARAARALSWSGEHGAVWLATGLAGAAADRAHRDRWLRATAVVTGAHLASMGVKRLVRRPRPGGSQGQNPRPLVRTAGRHGFPSSHAASSVAAALAYGALVPAARRVPLGAAAAAVCLSRVVAGVHYPSDVAAGAVLGAVAARLGTGGRAAARHGRGRAGPAARPAPSGRGGVLDG